MSKPFGAKLIAKLGVAAIITIGVVFTIIYITEKGCNAISDIAEKFKTGKVTTEFRDYVTELKGLQRFQVASLKTTDIFTRVDSRSIMWDVIPLGDVNVEIKLPVEYNYYLDFKDKWNFEWDENFMLIKVTSPKIKPNTPAVDISKTRLTIRIGSPLRIFDANDIADTLISELTDSLAQRAYQKIPFVRETARKAITDFVRDWFIQVYFKDSELKPKSISVIFEDEINQIDKNSYSIKIEKKLD